MKQIAITALSIWVMFVPQASRQPREGVPKKEGRTNAQLATDSSNKQMNADNAALNAVLAAIAKSEQERAKDSQQEESDAQKTIKAEWYLVYVGIAQAMALIGTLWAIGDQAKKTASAAKATQDATKEIRRQADIMEGQTRNATIEVVRLNRAYLNIDLWMPDETSLGTIGIKVRIYNPSRTAVRIEAIEYTCDNPSINLTSTPPEGRMLTPREGYWSHIVLGSLLDSGDPRNSDTISFTIRGRITYTDIFHRTRHRTFARFCKLGGMEPIFEDIGGAGLNDEEGWDKDE